MNDNIYRIGSNPATADIDIGASCNQKPVSIISPAGLVEHIIEPGFAGHSTLVISYQTKFPKKNYRFQVQYSVFCCYFISS